MPGVEGATGTEAVVIALSAPGFVRGKGPATAAIAGFGRGNARRIVAVVIGVAGNVDAVVIGAFGE